MLSVTAVIPTYNRAKMVVEAVESALGQTRPPDEIIIVDDGSTDDTRHAVAHYGDRLRYIRQDNSGPAAARNHGIRVASGDFIAFLDSDDLWVKDRLEQQLAALAVHPGLDLIFGLEEKFAPGRQFDVREIKEQEVWECLNSAGSLVPDPFGLLLKENFIPTSSVLFRRSCIATVGPLDSTVEPAEDYEFWFRFALQGFRFGFINAVLCRRRMHQGNIVNQWAAMAGSVAEVLRRYRDHSPAHRQRALRRLSGLHYDLGSHLLYRREFGRAFHYLRQASPGGSTRLAWVAKLAVARLLRHVSVSTSQ
jgi:glycosyltransferase involved in cell wall biosynthesis